jgi:hypothetical protein
MKILRIIVFYQEFLLESNIPCRKIGIFMPINNVKWLIINNLRKFQEIIDFIGGSFRGQKPSAEKWAFIERSLILGRVSKIRNNLHFRIIGQGKSQLLCLINSVK